jgi:hypothetical protein
MTAKSALFFIKDFMNRIIDKSQNFKLNIPQGLISSISNSSNLENIYGVSSTSIYDQTLLESFNTIKVASGLLLSIKLPSIALKGLQEALPFPTRQMINVIATVQKLLEKEFLRFKKLRVRTGLNYRNFRWMYKFIAEKKSKAKEALNNFLRWLGFIPKAHSLAIKSKVICILRFESFGINPKTSNRLEIFQLIQSLTVTR